MSTSRDKISIIIPVYNAQNTVIPAISSIITQTYENIELIVVDDCSTDSSYDLLIGSFSEDKRLRILRNERNLGVADTLNKALRHATGEFIARMDADDFSLPERLEKQWKYLKQHPSTGVLGTSIEFFGARQGKRIMPQEPEDNRVNLLFNSSLCHPTVMIRSCAMEPYDKSYEGCEDYELWWRLARKTEIANLREILLRYRIHPHQVTQRSNEAVRNRLLKFRRKQLSDILGKYSERELQLLAEFNMLTMQSSMTLVREVSSFFERIYASTYYQSEKRELRILLKNILLTLTQNMGYYKRKNLLRGSSIVSWQDLFSSWIKNKISRK